MSTSRLLRLGAQMIAAAGLLAACQSASGGAPSAPSAPVSTPTTAPSGPASLADWTARQGFGGGSGLAQVQQGAHWLDVNGAGSDASDAAFWWNGIAVDLAAWLDAHPATDCWAAYHAQVRAGLGNVLTELATIRAAVDAGHLVPIEPSAALVRDADALVALPLPSGCA